MDTTGTVRVDGRAKVTGAARYPSDEPVAHAAWAWLVTSAVARGRVRRIDEAEARAVPGVLDVLTHANVGHLAHPPPPSGEGGTTTTLESDRVWHAGQILAIVVAETYEAAREAGHRLIIEYDSEAPAADFESEGVEVERREPKEHKDYDVGDVSAALASSSVVVDACYETPTQHHNPIELFTTTCSWDGDLLTIHESSQFVYGLKASVAKQLRIDPDRVRVVSRYVGGAFGSRGGATGRTAWIAIAAARVGRPVKLVATRDDGFTIATYRAPTRHRVQLGADADGHLRALRHEGWELTSRPSLYNVSGTETTARMYACPNIQTRVNVVHADRATPGFMRAPPDTPYMFALECAIDELAERLAMDPIELRRRNEPERDPVTSLPFSGRRLMDCFDEGARRFGWSRRSVPGGTSDGDWLIGVGCASAAYPANIAATAARVRLNAAGKAHVEIAGHDIGTGAYTVVALIAAEALGIGVEDVSVSMGDTALPPASLAAGSSHSASIAHAVQAACDTLARQLRSRSGKEGSPLDLLRAVTTGAAEAYGESVPPGLPEEAMEKLYSGQPPILRGHSRDDVTAYSFGAQFVEVSVHRVTREIRIRRMLGVFASGRIINPLTAYSQYMGGMIWGIGAGLLEKTEIDPRSARYTNDNLGEYLVPVNADVGHVDVVMLDDRDEKVNRMGIKGIGEIGIVGVNAAIANAVYNATGRRVRRLPIRIEDILDGVPGV